MRRPSAGKKERYILREFEGAVLRSRLRRFRRREGGLEHRGKRKRFEQIQACVSRARLVVHGRRVLRPVGVAEQLETAACAVEFGRRRVASIAREPRLARITRDCMRARRAQRKKTEERRHEKNGERTIFSHQCLPAQPDSLKRDSAPATRRTAHDVLLVAGHSAAGDGRTTIPQAHQFVWCADIQRTRPRGRDSSGELRQTSFSRFWKAKATASLLEWTSSLYRMFWMWFRAVRFEMWRAMAISGVERPAASIPSTSTSRVESLRARMSGDSRELANGDGGGAGRSESLREGSSIRSVRRICARKKSPGVLAPRFRIVTSTVTTWPSRPLS